MTKKKLGIFILEVKNNLEEEKDYIQRAQEGEKELRTKLSCFRRSVICLAANQRLYFEEQQPCRRLRWGRAEAEREEFKMFCWVLSIYIHILKHILNNSKPTS